MHIFPYVTLVSNLSARRTFFSALQNAPKFQPTLNCDIQFIVSIRIQREISAPAKFTVSESQVLAEKGLQKLATSIPTKATSKTKESRKTCI